MPASRDFLDVVWRLHPEALEFIEGIGEPVTFQKDAQIFAEGEDGTAMYLILEGAVRVMRKKKVLAILGPQRSFGEVAMLTQSKRSAHVFADSQVRLLKITQANLANLSKNDPRVALQIFRILAESLAQGIKALVN
jgi:CRP-like cAMP-binding protein